MNITSIIAVVLIIVLSYLFQFWKNRKGYKNRLKRNIRERERREQRYDLSDLKELNVIIPEPKLTCARSHRGDVYYWAVLNETILGVKPPEAYPWFLEVFVQFEHADKDGFPNEEETQKMHSLFDKLNKKLAVDKKSPNAVFLGRVVGGVWGSLYWYLHNYDIADNDLFVMSMLKDKPLKFGFEITEDKNWEKAHSLIDPLETTPEATPDNNFRF